MKYTKIMASQLIPLATRVLIVLPFHKIIFLSMCWWLSISVIYQFIYPTDNVSILHPIFCHPNLFYFIYPSRYVKASQANIAWFTSTRDYCKKCTLIANLFLDNYHCCMPKCKFCYYYSFMLVKNRIKEISILIVLFDLH